jgi:2-hydroxycyclohexanecarboxyl-CoA dehydrogenase
MSDDGIVRDGFRPGDLVVVTGGGGGFGRAFCRRFAKAGARLAIWDVKADLGRETLKQAHDLGAEAEFFEGDLADSIDIDRCVAATLERFGAPYLLINNASIYPRFDVLNMNPDVWERTFRVNITAPFLISKAFGPGMIARKRGAIINIASGRGVEGTPGGSGYAATKAAMLSFTKSLALEWARHNIRVNAIIPGVSLTAQPLENSTEEEVLERGRKSIPLGRVGFPEDMAGLAAFLASPDAAYMTGQAVAMNGGRVLLP